MAEFIGVREVANKLKMKTNQVRVRACRYRQRGIPLKEYSFPDPPDWDALAAYAAELVAQDDPTNGGSEVPTEASEPPATH